MKRQIRRNVFETNSSSTHSVSIISKKEVTYHDIPKNSKVVIDGNYRLKEETYDELGKLNYIVIVLTSIVEGWWYDDNLEINSFEEMINLNWFKWLAEVIREESNTEIKYVKPYYDRFPYYDTTYDSDDGIEYIFTCGENDILTDKDKFKERVKDIIYNPSVVIVDKDNEY